MLKLTIMLLAGLMPAVSLLCKSATVQAQQWDSSAALPVLLAQSRGEKADAASGSEDKLKQGPPIGLHTYKTLAEVVDPATLKPGDKVQVHLVLLGDEGVKELEVLKKVTIASIERPQASETEQIAKTAEAEEANAAGKQAAEILPTRVIALYVNSEQLEKLRQAHAQGVLRIESAKAEIGGGPFGQVWHNFKTNLFQPLLLFFFMGFSVPILKVPFEFPKVLYQSLTIYLLIAIGWHGGELMAQQSSAELTVAAGLVVIGFTINGVIGFMATKMLDWFTPMRQIDAVTVGAYYGSDSAGTFVTCLGILATLGILHDSYMPVMLAVMEIPGCLVGLYLVSRLRGEGMDLLGNMPGEPDYEVNTSQRQFGDEQAMNATDESSQHAAETSVRGVPGAKGGFNLKIAHEVFLNPGLFLLFGGLIVGFISGLQSLEDPHVVEGPNHLFIFIFKGALCLFLLEMGMTACRRLSDLKSAGWGFILFGLLAPNLFATIGMLTLHAYSLAIGHEFALGTYALFAVLCGAASYIAVPAVQRLAIPEASPTLPLAASLGLTFTWNVTLGIPIYIEIAKQIITRMPVTI